MRNTMEDNQRQAASAARQESAAARQGLSDAYGQVPGIIERATDRPDITDAENTALADLSALESQYNVPTGQLTGRVRDVKTALSKRDRAEAKRLYDGLVERYGKEAVETDGTMTHRSDRFGDVTPSKLRSMFAPEAVDETGAPYQPPTAKKLTYGDLYPQVANTRIGSQPVPMHAGGVPNIAEASLVAQRNGWFPNEPDREKAKALAIQNVRDRLDYLILSNGHVQSMVRGMRSLALDPEVEISKANQRVQKAITDTERSIRPETQFGVAVENPAEAEARRERARQMLLTGTGLPTPTGGSLRADGTPKGPGFLGSLTRPDGSVSSEISIGVNIDGREIEIPTLVPTLTPQEVQWLLSHDVTDPQTIPDGIVQKAIAHARQRIATGQSPFADRGARPGGPGPATASPGVQPGARVRLKDGRTVTITKINPDGTFDYK